MISVHILIRQSKVNSLFTDLRGFLHIMKGVFSSINREVLS